MPQVVKLVTAPTVEPITLDEAKAHLRVSWTNEDALITTLISAARRLAEVIASEVFVTSTYDIIEDAFPINSGYVNRAMRASAASFQGGFYSTPISAFFPSSVGIYTVPKRPLQSVTSITYLDTSGTLQTLSPSVYTVATGSPGRIAPAFGQIWPVTLPQIGAVTYRVVCGNGNTAASVSDNVKAALKLLVGHLYVNREAVSQDGQFATLPLGIEELLGMESQGGYA